MFKYTTIATDDGGFELSSLLDEDYHDTSFTIKIDNEVVELWDNMEFLQNDLYHYLNGEHNDYLDDILSNYKEELLEMFDEAFKMRML